MKVTIDNKGICFADRRFIFNLYFLEDDSGFLGDPTPGGTFKKIVNKWAEVLQTICSQDSPIYLPYDPDDQWTDAFKATLVGEMIEFRWVRLAENGWGVFDYDLTGFMTSPHEITDESDQPLGEYDKDAIVSALINAEVIDGQCLQPARE